MDVIFDRYRENLRGSIPEHVLAEHKLLEVQSSSLHSLQSKLLFPAPKQQKPFKLPQSKGVITSISCQAHPCSFAVSSGCRDLPPPQSKHQQLFSNTAGVQHLQSSASRTAKRAFRRHEADFGDSSQEKLRTHATYMLWDTAVCRHKKVLPVHHRWQWT